MSLPCWQPLAVMLRPRSCFSNVNASAPTLAINTRPLRCPVVVVGSSREMAAAAAAVAAVAGTTVFTVRALNSVKPLSSRTTLSRACLGSTRRCSKLAAAGNNTPFVVAIDGPAASGKGTIAKRLATEQQLAHLDTGLLYRGVGWAALTAGIDLSDEQALADLAAGLNLSELESNKQLRGDQAAVAASKVSVLPGVRAALLQAQRRFANAPQAGFHGSVLDGRDVGTVVCPDAAVKLYVTADVEVRAQRRLNELHSRGARDTTYEEVLADMKARDARDMGRATAPLKPADDALVLDTTLMGIDAAYERAVAAVDAAKERQMAGQAVAAVQ